MRHNNILLVIKNSDRSSTSIINRMSSSSLSLPAWPIIATTSSPLSSSSFGGCSAQAGASAATGFGAGYDAPTPTNNSSSDVVLPPLKRKKSIFPMINKDTPILRTVLGQGQADSSQPIPLVCHSDDNNQEPMTQSNGPTDYVKVSFNRDDAEYLIVCLVVFFSFKLSYHITCVMPQFFQQ